MTALITPDRKLDLRGSETLAETLRARRGADIAVDLTGVEAFGAHAAQTLIVAHRSWEADGRILSVSGLSRAAAEALDTLGLAKTPPFDGARA